MLSSFVKIVFMHIVQTLNLVAPFLEPPDFVLRALRPCDQRRRTKTELYLLCVYYLFRSTGS